MNLKDCIKIAFLNLSTGKKSVVKIICGFSVVVFILFSLGLYFCSYQQYIRNFDEETRKDCYFVRDVDKTYSVEQYNKIYRAWSLGEVDKKLSGTCVSNTVEIDGNNRWKSSKMQIEQSGNIYRADNIFATAADYFGENTYDISVCDLAAYTSGYDFIPDNIMRVLPLDGNNEEALVGTLPENPGEILLSDLTLLCMGIPTKQQKSLIGKELSLTLAGKEGNVKLENYRLSGIYSARFLPLYEDYAVLFCVNRCVVNFRPEESVRIAVKEVRYYMESFDAYSENYGVICNEEKQIHGTDLADQYMIAKKEIRVVHQLLITICIFVLITMIICTKSMMRFFWIRNRKNLQIFRILGAQKNRLKVIVLIELLLMNMISLLIGGYLAIMLLNLVNGFYSDALGYSMSFRITNGLIAMGGVILFQLLNSDIVFIPRKMEMGGLL